MDPFADLTVSLGSLTKVIQNFVVENMATCKVPKFLPRGPQEVLVLGFEDLTRRILTRWEELGERYTRRGSLLRRAQLLLFALLLLLFVLLFLGLESFS
jgi:hypothetical protein